MNQDIMNRLNTLKADINTSPDYGVSATRKGRLLVNEIMTTLKRVQGKTMMGYTGNMKSSMNTMMGGTMSTGNVLGNIMGNSPYKKNRMAIIADINMVKQKINRDPNISGQVTAFVNRKLDMIKTMK